MSDDFESMGFWAGTFDFLHHMCLPLICFMASEFAFLTMLMKNSLLEEIRKEYIRTAMLKGQVFKKRYGSMLCAMHSFPWQPG